MTGVISCKITEISEKGLQNYRKEQISSPIVILGMRELISEDTRNILGLKLPTDPRWVNLAGIQLAEILTDHAYCEQKAATTCISLIQKNPDKELLVENSVR